MAWFKVYAEWAFDPKIQRMPERMQRRHWMLMALRSLGDLRALDPGDIAHALRISRAELDKTHALFVRKGFLTEDWDMPHWDSRQATGDPTAAERMRRYRDNLRNGRVTPDRNGPAAVTEPVTPTRARKKEREMEGKTEQRARAPRNVTDWEDPDAAYFEPLELAALQGPDWTDWVARMAQEGFPADWIAMVIRDLRRRGQMRTGLASKILDDWRRQGGPEKKPGSSPPPKPAPAAVQCRWRSVTPTDPIAIMWRDAPASMGEAEAKRRSEECPFCDGAGWAKVYRSDRPSRPPVNTHCLCPLGEWMRSRMSAADLKRFPDLANVLAGGTRWTTQEPDKEEA